CATLRQTGARPEISEKLRRSFCVRCFSKSGREKFYAVIIGAANENFPPRFGVSWSEIVAISELINFCRRQVAQQFGREITEQGITQAVDALKMFEKKDQPFQMRSGKLAVDAVEWMRNSVRNSIFRQVFLQMENVAVQNRD